MGRDRLVAGKFLTAGAIATAAVAIPQVVEGVGPCQERWQQDLLLCANARDECLNDPNYSFWTGTCNLQYVACTLGADLLLAVCLYEATT